MWVSLACSWRPTKEQSHAIGLNQLLIPTSQNNVFWSNFCWMIENLRPLFDKGVSSKFKCSQGLVCKQVKIASKSFCSSLTPRHLDKSSIRRMLFPSNAWSTWMICAGTWIPLSDSCCMVRLVRSIFATSLACSDQTRQNSSVVRVLLSWWPVAASGEKTANNLFNVLPVVGRQLLAPQYSVFP